MKFHATVQVKPLREWLEANLDPVEKRIVLPENAPKMTVQQLYQAMLEIWSDQPDLGDVTIDQHNRPLETVRLVEGGQRPIELTPEEINNIASGL